MELHFGYLRYEGMSELADFFRRYGEPHGLVLEPPKSELKLRRWFNEAFEFRRERIGQGIMERLIADARELECDAMQLHCRPENTGAVRLYEGLGFVQVPHTTCMWEFKLA